MNETPEVHFPQCHVFLRLPFISHQIKWFITRFLIKLSLTRYNFIDHQIKGNINKLNCWSPNVHFYEIPKY